MTDPRRSVATARRSPVRRVVLVAGQLVALAVMVTAYLAVVTSGRFAP